MLQKKSLAALAFLAMGASPAFAKSLDFKDFMAAYTRTDPAVHLSRESEGIWNHAELDRALGWDRRLDMEWRALDASQSAQGVQAEARAVQETPFGVQGQVEYKDRDPVTGREAAAVGMQVDLLRNRFGYESKQERELLHLRRDILGLKTQEAIFQSCVDGLNSVSRLLLLDRQKAVYQSVLDVRRQLRTFVQRKVSQGAMSQAELLAVEAEMTALMREVQAIEQAKVEWRAVESARLSQPLSDIVFPSDAQFIQFGFISQERSAWLPELGVLEKTLEEAKAQIGLLEEQGAGRLQFFGQKVEDLEKQGHSRLEYGLTLSLPLDDFARKRELSLGRLAEQDILLKKRLSERKATILMAETDARVAFILQRLQQGEKSLQSFSQLDKALWDQYRVGAVGLDRLLRQQELRLREELVKEQILHDLRKARTLYVLMQQTRPEFCVGG